MKTYIEFVIESVQNKDELGLHDKKIPIKTKDFSGHAHIKFQNQVGSRGMHRYGIEYSGKGPDGKDYKETGRLDAQQGSGFNAKTKYKMLGGSSTNDLSSVLHKSAPAWVSLKDLDIRPRKK